LSVLLYTPAYVMQLVVPVGRWP